MDKRRRTTLHERFDQLECQFQRLEHILTNDIKHELVLHRWLLGIILSAGAGLFVAVVIKVLLGG